MRGRGEEKQCRHGNTTQLCRACIKCKCDFPKTNSCCCSLTQFCSTKVPILIHSNFFYPVSFLKKINKWREYKEIHITAQKDAAMCICIGISVSVGRWFRHVRPTRSLICEPPHLCCNMASKYFPPPPAALKAN